MWAAVLVHERAVLECNIIKMLVIAAEASQFHLDQFDESCR